MDSDSHIQRPPTAEGIKARIRSEHAQISAQLARVEALTERVGEGDTKAVLTLREELETLGTILLEHLHYEEYQLSTLATNAKMDEAVESMRAEHESQREIFDSVIRDLDETAVGSKLVIGVRELARAIRDDMAHEEQDLLSKT